MTTPIHFYEPEDEWGWLTNLSRHAFTLDNRTWPSAEHYYQACKFVHVSEIFEKVAAAEVPYKAKMIAHNHEADCPADWYSSGRALEAMRRANHAKFVQNPNIGKKLLETGDRPLIERCDTDTYWADGPDGKGQNWAGRILMEVRDALKPA